MSKKFYTIALQYDIDGEPCDPPHHIEDRMVMLMQMMHEIGFGMDVSYGYADKKIMRTIEEGAKK